MPVKKNKNNRYGITEKENLFLDFYIANRFVGTQASKKVYNFKTDASHATNASEVLRKPKVQAALRDKMKHYLMVHGVRKEDVIKEMEILAFSDITDYLDFAGDIVQLKSSDKMGVSTKAIKKVTITPTLSKVYDDETGEMLTKETSRVQLELHNKEKPLEILGNALGAFDTEDEDSENRTTNINVNVYTPPDTDTPEG